MIQDGRAPNNRGERMIRNNYGAMQYLRMQSASPLTPAIVMKLQRRLTEGTLDELDCAGRSRSADEHIVIEDELGSRLHTPPPAAELQSRLEEMCRFANETENSEFIPPAVHAIVLHFWLAYDHPFVDGNGRTARAFLLVHGTVGLLALRVRVDLTYPKKSARPVCALVSVHRE
jgi:Fic family protein